MPLGFGGQPGGGAKGAPVSKPEGFGPGFMEGEGI